MNPSRPSFICASCVRTLGAPSRSHTLRQFSTTTFNQSKAEPPEELPRWAQTPPAMKMPVRLRPEPRQPAWRVNTDESKLDAAYDRFLGSVGGRKKGSELLDSETKVSPVLSAPIPMRSQPITHKTKGLTLPTLIVASNNPQILRPRPPRLQRPPRLPRKTHRRPTMLPRPALLALLPASSRCESRARLSTPLALRTREHQHGGQDAGPG